MEKRLQNILAQAGIASRRGAGKLIEEGQVKVDGRCVREKGLKVDPEEHEITVEGRALPQKEKKYYFLFHKPKDMISTAKDTHDRSIVLECFKDIDARLYPIGRLDKDTTGLLIITNDGDLTNKLSHPRYETDKEYVATVRGKILVQDIKELADGVMIDGKRTTPCSIKVVKEGKEISVFRMKLHEGRNRQIKRMFESVGGKVTALKRVKYAGLTLGRLKEGEWRELTESEVKRLAARTK